MLARAHAPMPPPPRPLLHLLSDEDQSDIDRQRRECLDVSASEIRRVLDEYARIHDHASAPESPTGALLETGRLGLSRGNEDAAEWQRSQSTERIYQRHALLVHLWSGMSPMGRGIIRSTLTANGWEKYERMCREGDLLSMADLEKRQGGLCLEGLATGGLCRRSLEPGWSTCANHRERRGVLRRGGQTARGESYVRKALPKDFPAADPEPGWIIVSGIHLTFPSYRLLAEALGDEFDELNAIDLDLSSPKPGEAPSHRHRLYHAALFSRRLLFEESEEAMQHGQVGLCLAELRQDDGTVRERTLKRVIEGEYSRIRRSDVFRLLRGG